MKNLLFIIFFIPIIGFATNNPPVGLSKITNAISKGDANTLGNYFDTNVELAVLDDEDVYNKAEAIMVLKRFFSSNQPKSYSQVHQGTSKGQDSIFCIGNMVTSSGTFRVYVYMKMNGDLPLIQELRFDKE